MTAQQASLSTCLCVKLHLSASQPRELKHRFQEQKPSPFQKEARRGIKRSCLFAAQSNTKASPFPSLRVHSKLNPTVRRAGHYAKPDWRAALAGYWQNPLANTGEPLRLDPSAKDTQQDTRRDPLAAALAGYSAGLLWWDTTGEVLWRDTRRDPPASYSEILSRMLGRIHWWAVVGYWAGSTGKPLWRDTGRRIHWRATASSSGGILGGGSTGEPLASRSGGILGGIH